MSQDESAVNTEVVADATTTESAPVEEQKSEEVERSTATDSGEYSQSDIETDSQPEEPESEEKPQEETQEESKEEPEPEQAEETDVKDDETKAHDDSREEKPLAPKSVNRFQQLANENRELRGQLTELQAKQAQVATEQELLGKVNPETGEHYTLAEAERVARYQANEQTQQSLAQQQYQLEVQQNRQKITTEAQQALQEFPELDSTSDKYDAEIAAEFDTALSQALILDQQGAPIGAYLSPYQLAKSIAGPVRKATERAKALGQAEAQKAQSKMLASADPSSSSHQTDKPFNKMSLNEMEEKLRKKGYDI